MIKYYWAVLLMAGCLACAKEETPPPPPPTEPEPEVPVPLPERVLLTKIKDVIVGSPTDTTWQIITYNKDSTIAFYRHLRTSSRYTDTFFNNFYPTYEMGKLIGIEQLGNGQPKKVPMFNFEYENGKPRYYREFLLTSTEYAETLEGVWGSFEFNAPGGQLSLYWEDKFVLEYGYRNELTWTNNNISELKQFRVQGGVSTLSARLVFTYGTQVNSLKSMVRDAFLWHLAYFTQRTEFDGYASLNQNLYTRLEHFSGDGSLAYLTDVQYFVSDKQVLDSALYTVKEYGANGRVLTTIQRKRYFVYENVNRPE